MENQIYTVTQLTPESITKQAAGDISGLISELSGRPIHLNTQDLLRMVAKNYMVVALADQPSKQFVGLGCLVIMDLPQGKRMLAESIVVHPAFRKRGIGESIVKAMLEETKRQGGDQLSLTCRPTRNDAQRLYKSLGFKIADTALLRAPLSEVA